MSSLYQMLGSPEYRINIPSGRPVVFAIFKDGYALGIATSYHDAVDRVVEHEISVLETKGYKVKVIALDPQLSANRWELQYNGYIGFVDDIDSLVHSLTVMTIPGDQSDYQMYPGLDIETAPDNYGMF